MGKIIVKNAVVRKKGYLYYLDKEGNVVETPMSGGRKSKKTKSTEKKK